MLEKLKSKFVHFFQILKQTAVEWNRDNSLSLAAALSYYTVFSIGPLLILVTGILGLLFEKDKVQGQLTSQFRDLMGDQGAKVVESLVISTQQSHTGLIATIIGFVTLLMGATGAFAELKHSLNLIWHAEPEKISGIKAFLKTRVLSFGVILAIGFLLLVSLIMNAVLLGAWQYISELLSIPAVFIEIIYLGVSLAMVTLLFAFIFKVLPDAQLKWSEVWLGAFVTAVLFTIGKFLIGLYIGKSSLSNSFGASATVAIIMVWAYYSALILLFGAEFTKVLRNRLSGEAERTRITGLGEQPA